MSPVIGILFCGFDKNRQFVTSPYIDAISDAGGIPVIIPYPGKDAYFSKYFQICDGFLFCGGGDITPAFFGQQNRGSRNIDTELDILQMQALESFLQQGKPVLGICKGLQVINVAFGGTITQHILTAANHQWNGADQRHQVYHSGLTRTDFFYQLYGLSAPVNSAHHQAIDSLGKNLLPVCRAADNIVEGIQHIALPVIAVQWHPERLPDGTGDRLLQYFAETDAITIPH